MEHLEDLNKNQHKIKDAYRDKNGSLIREVDGKKITQIEEKTEEDIRLNNTINLWRMRSKHNKF